MFHPFISKLPQVESRFSKRLTPQPKETELFFFKKRARPSENNVYHVEEIPIVCTLPMTKALDI